MMFAITCAFALLFFIGAVGCAFQGNWPGATVLAIIGVFIIGFGPDDVQKL